jgi:glycosyltransferase involved in cell wall biosynthesis
MSTQLSEAHPSTSNAHVAILMCTFNGAVFLEQQLDSIAKQTHTNWSLWVSDDDSKDDTKQIVQRFAQQLGAHKVHLIDGPQQGFANNFFSLMQKGAFADAHYFSFADQDDLWLPTKLERAIQMLSPFVHQAALYAGPTIYIDEQTRLLGYSVVFERPPCFENALVQSIGGGNTMMINRRALDLICQVSQQIDIVSHDWWVYIVITAMGGVVHYDPSPMVLYRQHSGNLMGMNTTLAQRARRVAMLISGIFRNWNERNIAALLPLRLQMSEDAREIFDAFCMARNKSLFERVRLMRYSGIYRQTLLGNLGLWFAVVINRI